MSNSWLCGVQGTLLMYLVLVLLCLSFFLITNLHVLTVYRSSLVQNRLTSLIVLSFFLPLALVLPVVIRKQIENPGFGSICFVSSTVASPYFFYPLSIVVCLAMALHIGTVFFMIRASLKANNASSTGDSTSYNPNDSQGGGQAMSRKQLRLQKARDISLLLKQQWRPGLFAFCLLVIDMIYWLFYFVEAKKLSSVSPTTPWFIKWLECLTQQAVASLQTGVLSLTPTAAQFKEAGDIAQRACAPVASPFVPSFSWAALADAAPGLFGPIILIIFGSKLELWQDLRNRIMGGSEDTVFIMGDITKDSKDQQQQIRQDKRRQEQQEQLPQYQNDDKHDDGFYSDDMNMADNVYSSRDVLTHAPEAALRFGTNARYGGRSAMSPQPTSPTSPSSPRGAGGAQRKVSITIRDNREPVYYRNPGQEESGVYQGQQDFQYRHDVQQQRAQLVTEGSEPWPAWPSSSPTQSSSQQPSLTIMTNYGGGANGGPIPGSAGGRIMSPVTDGFYNVDDLSTTQSYQHGQQQQQQQQQQHYQQRGMQQVSPVPSSSGGRAFSPQPPVVPQKSRRRG
ncbi:hypothetical protein BGZ58_007888 [Dissophora ornata]|nr:hypothetical protein BGZ58_007888 [Dissophora ornata]